MQLNEQPDFAPDEAQESVPGGKLGPDLRSVIEEAKRLAADGRTYAEAELAFQISRAKVLAVAGGWMAGLGLAALIFLHFALVALVVGLLIALATLIGPWWSILVVAGGLAALCLASLLLLRARWRRASALAFGPPGKPK